MRFAILLLVALLTSEPAFSREPAAPTRSQLQRLSDDALVRRIFGPLAPDLLVGYRGGRGNAVSIWFWTRARRSMNPGVCEADRLIVHLWPDLTMPRSRDPKLRLHNIEAETYFIVQDREVALRANRIDPRDRIIDSGVREGLEAACATLDPRRDPKPADGSMQLVKALSLLNELGAAARAGHSPAPIDCTKIDPSSEEPVSEARCLAELSNLPDYLVQRVDSCGETPAIPGNCIRVETDRWNIFFVLDRDQRLERVIIGVVEITLS